MVGTTDALKSTAASENTGLGPTCRTCCACSYMFKDGICGGNRAKHRDMSIAASKKFTAFIQFLFCFEINYKKVEQQRN